MINQQQRNRVQVMNWMNNDPLMNNALEGYNEDEILLVDKVYAKAYKHFQICTIIAWVYSILKVCAAPFFIIYSEPYKQLESIWLEILIPLSVMQAAYFWRVRKYSKKQSLYLSIADQVRHAGYFNSRDVSREARFTHVHDNIISFRNPLETEVRDKQMKILSFQIQYMLLKQNKYISSAGILLFTINLVMQIWGCIIFVNTTKPNLQDYLIFVVLFLGTYQYLQIYIGLAFFIFILPFILIYIVVKQIKKRKKNQQLNMRLKGIEWNCTRCKGEQICHICIDEYKQGDIITILACNQMHHFHKECLAEWIKVSNTCPICRVQISSN